MAIQYNMGQHTYVGTMSWQRTCKQNKELVETLLEVIVHSAFHSVGLKSKIHISVFPTVHVVLVEHVIQALVEVLEVEKDHCSSSLHANLNLVDVSTNLRVKREKIHTISWQNATDKNYHT